MYVPCIVRAYYGVYDIGVRMIAWLCCVFIKMCAFGYNSFIHKCSVDSVTRPCVVNALYYPPNLVVCVFIMLSTPHYYHISTVLLVPYCVYTGIAHSLCLSAVGLVFPQ